MNGRVSLSLFKNPNDEFSIVKQFVMLKSLQIDNLAQFSLYFWYENLQLKNLNISVLSLISLGIVLTFIYNELCRGKYGPYINIDFLLEVAWMSR